MQMTIARFAGFAMAALAGCGPSGPRTDEERAYQALFDETVALRGRYAAAVETPPGDLPSGVQVYDGTAVINLATPTRSVLIGDAQLVAGFATNVVAGSASNFVSTVDGGKVASYAGSLTIDAGSINTSRDFVVQGDVGGVLTGGGGALPDVVEIDGRILGNFLGPNAEAIEAHVQDSTVFTLNGTVLPGGPPGPGNGSGNGLSILVER